MELVHCIYCSSATSPKLDRKELDRILKVARAKNALLGVTGILLFENGSFFQVLEGDRPAVEGLFAKIGGDPRHRGVTKIIEEPIEKRAFREWTMGFPRLSTEELGAIPGLNDFFREGRSFLELGKGRANSLLSAFRDGRWRVALS